MAITSLSAAASVRIRPWAAGFHGCGVRGLEADLGEMLKGYVRHRAAGESFQAFTARHDLNQLQAIFSNEE